MDSFPDASLKVESKAMRHETMKDKTERERSWCTVWVGLGEVKQPVKVLHSKTSIKTGGTGQR